MVKLMVLSLHTAPESISALGLPAYLLVLGLALHRPFADDASLAIEAAVTALNAEGLPGVGDG
jgi:hypothetical protein